MANENLMQTRFGSREICNVTFKTKAAKTIGGIEFAKGQPVFIFDSLKTSTLESTATSVYATGGRGNSRLVAWEGEKTVTFTMEDALISPLTFSILSGAGVTVYNGTNPTNWGITHFSSTGKAVNATTLEFDDVPFVMNGNDKVGTIFLDFDSTSQTSYMPYIYEIDEYGNLGNSKVNATAANSTTIAVGNNGTDQNYANRLVFTGGTALVTNFVTNNYYLFDGYVKAPMTTLTVGPEDFAGSYYIEADTLFREEATGEDKPAQFIIPHGKVQSQYTFSMAATGDPSTFTFTVDAFPDYVAFDRSRKVLFALNILG